MIVWWACGIVLVIYFIWLYRAVAAQEADRKARPEYYQLLASIRMGEPVEETMRKKRDYDSALDSQCSMEGK